MKNVGGIRLPCSKRKQFFLLSASVLAEVGVGGEGGGERSLPYSQAAYDFYKIDATPHNSTL